MSQTKLKTHSPLANISGDTSNLLEQKSEVQSITDNLRDQQGPLQSMITGLRNSKNAGIAERSIKEREMRAQVEIAGVAISLAQDLMIKTMATQAAGQIQQKNEKLLIQQTEGNKRTGEIFAEGALRLSESFMSQRQEIDQRARNGQLDQQEYLNLKQRLAAANHLITVQSDTAFAETLSDANAVFGRARGKLND